MDQENPTEVPTLHVEKTPDGRIQLAIQYASIVEEKNGMLLAGICLMPEMALVLADLINIKASEIINA